MDITSELVKQLVDKGTKPSSEFNTLVAEKMDAFISTNNKKPNSSELKYIQASAFVDMHYCV